MIQFNSIPKPEDKRRGRLVVFTSSESAGEFLEVSEGVVRQNEGFQIRACVPKADWRPLTSLERTDILGDIADAESTDWMCLWKIPYSIWEFLRIVSDGLSRRNSSHIAQNLFTHPVYKRGISELISLVRRSGGGPGLRAIGSYVGLERQSSTSVGKDGLFVGLHLDTWNKRHLISERGEGFPNRLCVNVGPEDRYLQFVGRSISQIQKSGFYPSDNSNDFVHTFFDSFPKTLVYRLRIPPGYGYIASTDTVIHDGSTLDKSNKDAVFAMLGHFSLDVVSRLLSDDTIINDVIRRRYFRSDTARSIML